MSRYLLALFFVAAAVLMREVMGDVLGPTPLLVFYLAWVAAATVGGLGPGLLATVVSWLCVNIFFEPTFGHVGFDDPASVGRFVIFMAGGLIVSLMGEKMRRARIRERRRARELAAANAALRESEEKYRHIVETATEGIVMADAEARIIFVNDRGLEFLGYRREDAGRMTLFDLVFPEDLAVTKQRWESRKQGRKERYEFHLRRKDGSAAWALISMTPRLGPAGEFLGELVMAVDITQRRQAEEALRRSEARLNLSQEIAHLGSWELDLETDHLSWSDEVYRIFGLAPQEFGATYEAFLERVHPDDRQAVDEAYRGSIREGRDVYEIEHRIVRQDTGEVRTVHEKCEHFRDAAGRIVRSVGMVHDITERQHAEEALAESRKRYRGLVEKINDWVWEVGADCRYSYSSPRAEELLGYAPEEIVGKTPFDLMPPDEARRVSNTFEPIWRERKPFELLENTLRRKDGRLITVETSGMPIFAEDGSFRGYTGVDRDVTSRKQAEEALRRSEEQFHQLFEDDLTGDFVSTPEGEILLCNPAFARIFGFSRTVEAVGTSIVDLYLDPGERRPLLERLQREGKIERLEVWRQRRDGEPIYIVENIVGRFDAQGRLYEIKGYLFEDTQRRRAEEALRELTATLESRVAERTEELEQRARQLRKLSLELSEAEERERERVAAVLHDDLQQVLAAAKFQVGLLRGGARGPDQAQEILGRVKEMLQSAIEKSRHLSHELSPAVLRQGDLAAAFDWLAEQMQVKHGLTVRVEASGTVEAWSEAVKTLMYRSAQEMLFNVVKHAEVGEARLRIRRRGRFLCLSVSDRGRGFDPQEISKTAGLGLRTIRERVALLGGRMEIRSARGRGTTFRIIMPDAESSPDDAALERETNSLRTMWNTPE